jgi:ferredoxin
MPVIRFVREGLDVECYPGENLREVALREGIELYGLKGKLGNCGGCGQCITCFVDVEGAAPAALSPLTAVEEQKLRRRPQTWRLACQALVEQSLLVLTRPQTGLADREAAFAEARGHELPAGPTAWPAPPPGEEESDDDRADGPLDDAPGSESAMGDLAPQPGAPGLSATSGEAGAPAADRR